MAWVRNVTDDGYHYETDPGPKERTMSAFPSERMTVMENVLKELRDLGKFPATCATMGPGSLTPTDAFAVLGEEVGEVARHVTEWRIAPERLDRVKLQKELIEVAAVCVAWAEKLAAEMAGEPNL